MGTCRPLRLAAALFAGVVALIAAGCGSSTSQSITSPSSDARCNLTVSFDGRPIEASGGAGTLSIGINRECSWTARSEADWIALGGAAGQGNASLAFTVAGNALVSPRRGAIVVNERRIEVSQTGAPCVFKLGATTRTVDAEGDRYAIAVTAQTGCAWTASTPVSWIELAPASGSGAGSLTVTVARNEGPARTGAILVAGLTHTVFQTAPQGPPTPPTPEPPGEGCSYELSTGVQPVGAEGGDGAVTVIAPPACPWTGVSLVDWVTVTGGTPGTGTADLRFVTSPNPSTTARIGALTVAGRTLTVTQVGAAPPPQPPPTPPPTPPPPTPPPPTPPEEPPPACSFIVTPPAITQDSAAATVTVTVTATAATCAWTAAPGAAWITTSSLGGTGSGDLRVTIAANPDTATRTGAITVAGHAIPVSQAGAAAPPAPPCTFTVTPATQTVAAAGASGQVTVGASAATCTWAASSSAAWLTITAGASGTGPGTVAFAAAANPDTAPRTATLTVAGGTVTVTQEAAPPPAPVCTYGLSRTELTVAAIDLTESVRVETAAGCAWTAQSQAAWITITSGASGAGPGEVRFTVGLNVALTRRTGTILVAGQTVTVTQAGLLGAQQSPPAR